MKVREILKEKGSDVITIDLNASVIDLARLMKDRKIGALLVEEDGRLRGIVTERDVAVTVGRTDGELTGVLVSDIMVASENLMVTEPDDLTDYVMAVMVQRNIRHMPVIDEGEIVGLLSIRDVVRAHVKKLQAQVRYFAEPVG